MAGQGSPSGVMSKSARRWRIGRLVTAKTVVFGLLGATHGAEAQTSTREYSVIRRNNSPAGVIADVFPQPANCQTTTQTGFVYNAVWQSTDNQNQWLEVGITRCDLGHPAPRHVYAWGQYSPSNYQEWYIGGATVGVTHEYKIVRTSDTPNVFGNFPFNVALNGTVHATFHRPSTFSDNVDVGLEVVNRNASTSPSATAHSNLRRKTNTQTTLNWNGFSSCTRTGPLGGQLFAPNNWKTSLNDPIAGGNSC